MEIIFIIQKLNKFKFQKNKYNNIYKKFIYNINISFYIFYNRILFFKFILSLFYIIFFIFTFDIENLYDNKFIYK